MKRVAMLFDSSWCLPVLSIVAFVQASCSFVLGAMCDGGLDVFPAWPALGVGWLIGSIAVAFSASLMAPRKNGYSLGKLVIAPCFLFLYSLLAACLLCFALFGSLSLAFPSSFLSRPGFIAIILPTLSLVLDGASFFVAFALRKEKDENE